MNSVQMFQPLPTGIPEPTSRAQFNNAMAFALASGDPRMAAKQYDRKGFSRGAGQMNQAGIDAANSMAEGIAQAYSGNLQNQQYNALSGLQAQQAEETQAQSLGALQQQNNYANQMAALQQQNQILSLLGGLLR
jgi:hypothetical protein